MRQLQNALLLSLTCFMLAMCNSNNNDKTISEATAPQNIDSFIHNYIKSIDSTMLFDTDFQTTDSSKNLDKKPDTARSINDDGNLPHTYTLSNLEKVEGDFDNDGEKDYLISYTAENNWGGIGANNYLSNYFFITTKKGMLKVDESLSISLKRTFLDTLAKYCPNIDTVIKKTSSINQLDFTELKNNVVSGSFSILWCGDSRYLKGNFEFNIENKLIKLSKLEKEKIEEQKPLSKEERKKANEKAKKLADELMKASKIK